MKLLQKHTSVGLTLLFGAFMLVQLMILRLGNQAGRGFLPEGQQELVYAFLQVIVILGFLAHALLPGRITAGRAVLLPVLGVCLAGAAVMLFAPPDSLLYLIVTGVTVFLLGVTGGAVYLKMTRLIAGGARAGLCVGTGYAAAIALQFCTQLQWTLPPVVAVLLALGFGVLAWLLPQEAPAALPPQQDGVARRRLVYVVVITVAMLIFTGYFNRYIHHLQIASGYTQYSAYAWPRLLLIPGMVLFGVLGDLRRGRLLPIGSLCMVIVALLNAVLVGRETYLLNMCLYYLALTAVVAYYHLTFLRLANNTKRPALWACMGRMLDSAVVILSFIPGFSELSTVAVLVIDIIALAVTVILMAVNGDFNLSAAPLPQEPAPAAAVTEDAVNPFDAVGEQCKLTPTEGRVLRELVQTDDKQDVIAARMSISVSTLRHHVTAIYKKTGVQTRAALCKLIADYSR